MSDRSIQGQMCPGSESPDARKSSPNSADSATSCSPGDHHLCPPPAMAVVVCFEMEWTESSHFQLFTAKPYSFEEEQGYVGGTMENAEDGVREDVGVAIEDVGVDGEDVGGDTEDWGGANVEGDADNDVGCDGDTVDKNEEFLRTRNISSRFNLYATIISLKSEVHDVMRF